MSGVPVLRPTGEIDIAVVPRLRDAWLAMADADAPPLVVVDLGQVTFLDVSGVGLLLALRNRQGSHGGSVHLRRVPAQVARVLEVTEVAELFPVEQAPRPRHSLDVVDLRARQHDRPLR